MGQDCMKAKKEDTELETVDEILGSIIDEWYDNVCSFYRTVDEITPDSGQEPELKRFHDEKGHRIKFNKDDLDFTYGLKSRWDDEDFVIEISVNNKVENFNYDRFQAGLVSYYEKTGDQNVPTPYELRTHTYQEVFDLKPSFYQAFSVERRPEKADIMRLAFRMESRFLGKLAMHPVACKQLIENYCVSPFRSVYAKVYRRR